MLGKVVEKFKEDCELIALTGPDYLFDSHLLGKFEYVIYNAFKYIFARFPRPFKRFPTSTNFLVVRKSIFEKVGGFKVGDINADGLMGRSLLQAGKVAFELDTYVFASGRRLKTMGFMKFNRHYLYALENYFFFLSKTGFMKALKRVSKVKHREIHRS